MNDALLVPLMPRNNLYALPPKKPKLPKKEQKPELLKYVSIAEAMTGYYDTDAHFAAYSMPDIPHRLAVASVRDPEWVPKFPDGIAMRLAIFDIDCPETHGTKTSASDTWWLVELEKVERLLLVHPDAFVYRTRGGYRLLYRIAEFRVTTKTEPEWTMQYARWIAYFARVFQIQADVSCADWTRLFRVPHATRDDAASPEEREVIGDPNSIGTWLCETTEEDNALARKLKPPKEQPKKRKPKVSSVPSLDAGSGVLFYAMQARGWVGSEISLNKWTIACPWESQHSKGSTFDTSTVLFAPGEGEIFGWPKCSHAHCAHRTLRDWLGLFSPAEIDAAKIAAIPPSPPIYANGVTNGAADHGAAFLDPKSTDDDGITASFSDVSNAEKLVARHLDDLRYVATWGKWIFWDGKRWSIDSGESALRFAVLTARAMMKEARESMEEATKFAADAAASGDEEAVTRSKSRMKWAMKAIDWAQKSHSRPRLEAMLAVACADPRVAIRHERLDTDPWLLNVGNGTIDLRTGILRSHLRDDLITKITPVEYKIDAKAPTWLTFLDAVMANDSDLVSYLACAVGYALTGEIRDHVLIFFHGETGSNGKSTFLQTIHRMLGEYATPAARKLLFRSNNDRHPTELATLHGKRFVTCAEIEEGSTFDEGLVKDLTGGDMINARRMREDDWSFPPTHKLFIYGNHKPRIRGTDGGIWRRIHLVPWLVCFEATKDLTLPMKLEAELPGILAWAVRGCIGWQHVGLVAPDSVRAATRDYRDESNPLGEFIQLRCALHPEVAVSRRALREAYERHCRENGEKYPLGPKPFAAKLRAMGATDTTVSETTPLAGTHVVNAWRGIRLLTEEELGKKGSVTRDQALAN